MSKKEYVSPQFEWISVVFNDNILSGSMPYIGEDTFGGDEGLLGDDLIVSGENLVNENNVFNSWGGW